MLTDDWYPFRRHLAIGTDGTLTRTGSVDIFDADTGVPVEARHPSAPGAERGTGAVMGAVDVVEFATVEFEARSTEVYGQSAGLPPIKMQSPEGMVNEAVKAVVAADVGDAGVAALLSQMDSETRAQAVALIEQIAPDAGGVSSWLNLNDKPAEGALRGVDGVTVIEDQNAGTVTVTPTGRLAEADLTGALAGIDYVDTLARLSNYDRMTVKRTASSNTLRITCWAPNGHTVSYDITWSARYQYVSTVYGSTGGVSGTYELTQARAYPQDVTLGGAYVSVGSGIAAGYTTTVGATFQTTITTRTANAQVNVSTTVDNRGGVWNVTLAEEPGITGSFSVWNSTTTIRTHTAVLTIPEPGTYTFVATFAGADPTNAPSGGVPARGWLVGPDNSNAPTFVTVNELAPVLTRLSQTSNKDFAISLKPTTGGAYEFVPWHGTETEAFASPTLYLAGGKPIDVTTLPLGVAVDVDNFEIIQHIYGRNSHTGTANLAEFWTKQRFTPDGVYSVTGRWKTLTDVLSNNAAFTMMLPADMPIFDQVASALGNGYAVTPAMAVSNIWLPEDDRSSGYAALSSTSDFAAAVTYANRAETLRAGAPDKPPPGEMTFIELRSGGTMLKVYSRLFDTDTLLPAGTVHRFAGSYFFGSVPGANDTLSLL